MEENNSQLICSLATWRTLRKSNKTQLDIITTFCKDIIGKYYTSTLFDIDDIASKIKENYSLAIPPYIIKEALYKNLKEYLNSETNGKWRTIKQIIVVTEIDENATRYEEEYKIFKQDLNKFMENKKQSIDKDFIAIFNEYILREDRGYIDKKENKEIYAYFAEFLFKNEKYNDLLQTIKEGVILYQGLTYNIEKPRQTDKLILFLDTEILFHAMGYNGELYKKRFDDFYRLVCKYHKNDKTHLLMPLYYSVAIKDEVDRFFYSVATIKENGWLPRTLTAAMQFILEKCETKEDIEEEKTTFFYTLKKEFQIQEYDKSYEDILKESSEFNLEGFDVLKNIKEEKRGYDEEDIDKAVNLLSFVNMVRQCKPKNLFVSKAMLISDKNLTNDIAWHKDLMENKTIPLANNLIFFTNRLWEFVETSLGEAITLSSHSPILNLQITLKEILQNNLQQLYDKTMKEVKDTDDKDLLKQKIIDIQDKMKLEPNTENIETFEIIFSSDELEEQRRLYSIEIDKVREKTIKEQENIREREVMKFHQEGIKKGKELERQKIELEKKREEKRKKYILRIVKYKIKKCRKNIGVHWKKCGKIYKACGGIIGFIAALIAIFEFSKGYFNAN